MDRPAGRSSGIEGEMPMTQYTIAIVDDQVDVRQLLAIRLGMIPNLKLVGQGANGEEAVTLAHELSPDLMTLDLRMPVMSGADAIPLLRAAHPHMRIVVYTSESDSSFLEKGSKPDAIVLKGASLGDLAAVIVGLLAEGPQDLVRVNVGRLPVSVAIDAFDSWVGLNARVRKALVTDGDISAELLGGVAVNVSDLLCLMGVFMQFGMPLMVASAAGEREVDIQFTVTRAAGAAARRALLALGGNGTLRAFNQAWAHKPSREAEEALDLVDSRLVDQLPVS